MELDEEIPNWSRVLLCNKCLEKKEYNIPLFELNDKKEIEYKCIKKHIIGKKDISRKWLNNKIKRDLTYCKDEVHINHEGQEKIFCAFCEKCGGNICQIEVGKDLKKGHNYNLYMNIMVTIPENLNKYDLKQKLDRLKSITIKYKKLYPEKIEEIKYLVETYNRKFMS